MKLGAAFVAGPRATEIVQPGEGSLDYPADLAEAGSVVGLPPRDDRLHASRPQLPAVLVVVIAAVGDEPVRREVIKLP